MSKSAKPAWAVAALSLTGFSLLWTLVFSAGFLQIAYLPQAGPSLFASAAAFVLACSASLLLFAAGRCPLPLYSGRVLVGSGAATVVFGMLLLAVALGEQSANALLLFMAALLLGFAATCGYVLWADACASLPAPVFPAVLFGSFLVAYAMLFVCLLSSWVCWGVAFAAGVLAFSARPIAPFLKSIVRMHGFSFVAERKESFARLSGTAFLLACVWGYSIRHFATHMEQANVTLTLTACISGVVVCLGVMTAVSVLGKGKASGGFAVLKALPIVMVFSFVPLEYLGALSASLQIGFMMASGGALVPLLIVISRDCARLLCLKPIATDAFTLASAMFGALTGATVNVFVGSNTSSVVWVIAPAVCLIVGIGVCEFLLTRAAIEKCAIKSAEETSDQGSFAESMGKLKDNCIAVSRTRDLTAREFDVLCMLVQGYSVSRVSEVLHIAEGTAATHKRHIYRKLDVHTKNELIDLVKNTESG